MSRLAFTTPASVRFGRKIQSLRHPNRLGAQVAPFCFLTERELQLAVGGFLSPTAYQEGLADFYTMLYEG